MKRLIIEICDHWDGEGRVCDKKRCGRWITADCYHKPFLVNGKRRTVKDTILIVFQVPITRRLE